MTRLETQEDKDLARATSMLGRRTFMSPTAPARLAGRSRPPSLFDYDRPSLLMRRSHKTRCSQPGRPSPRSWARGGKKGVERDERRLARTPETSDRRAALEEGTRTVPFSRRPRRPSGRPWRSSRATSPSSYGCLSERRRGERRMSAPVQASGEAHLARARRTL
jgi:hypothetical protein